MDKQVNNETPVDTTESKQKPEEECTENKLADYVTVNRKRIIKKIQEMFQWIGPNKLNYWGVENGNLIVPLGCLKCSACRVSLADFVDSAMPPNCHLYFCNKLGCLSEYQSLSHDLIYRWGGDASDIKEACKPYWDYVAKISQNWDIKRALEGKKPWVPCP